MSALERCALPSEGEGVATGAMVECREMEKDGRYPRVRACIYPAPRTTPGGGQAGG
jgi:hypothetical protein